MPKTKKEKVKPKKVSAGKKEKLVGEVSNYFEHAKAAAIKLKSPLKVGDKIHIKGGEKDFVQKAKSMQIHRKDVKSGKKGDEVGLIVDEKVRKGYKVFLVE
ncbi:MAG: translation elongation factor-like protein [archaeon]